jgi:Fe2+ transport system protein FeoA
MRNRYQHQHKHQSHPSETQQYFSLVDLLAEQSGVVVDISGDKQLVNRMISLGFTIGAQVKVLINQRHGPILVSILGSHFALGRREADLIHIQPL